MSQAKTKVLDVFNEYATDDALETSGVWRDLNKAGSRILVARLGNEEFDELLQTEIAKASDTLSLGGSEAEKAYKEIILKVTARTILKGWENLAYKGEVIEYSPENAEKLLRHRDFLKVVERMASEVDKFRLKVEEDQGNG